ncbi:hypothetical protein XthCFBP4691_17115 [Xanthomonas theicola]|uniref:Uncharacterized protein n=1 Tax=Xanthomonas theicola TaxID=56464 RepID=A0A2S6ZBS1_9XANT|nr:hypothetical protein XthCFBP4691_17115 [Xanthomonas theicola]
MICSSVNRFFTSNLLGVGNWTPNRGATQNRGDVEETAPWRNENWSSWHASRRVQRLNHKAMLSSSGPTN